MRLTRRKSARRGAATLEAAITVTVFLTLVLGTVDLGVGVARYNTLSQAARYGARHGTVHGSLATVSGKWGPTTVTEQADAGTDACVVATAGMLANCPLDESSVTFEWPDGDNEPGSRVRVTVTSAYRPMITFIFGNPSLTLSASSTMIISH